MSEIRSRAFGSFAFHGQSVFVCHVIALEVWHHHVMHHAVITFGDSRLADAELLRNLFSLKSLHEEHLKDDGVLAVASVVSVANLVDGVAEVSSKLIVLHVEVDACIAHAFLQAFLPLFLLQPFQLVEHQEAEPIDHPCLKRHRSLAVLQLTEVMPAEREVILMGKRIEVHAWLVLQIITSVVYAVSHAAVAVEVFLDNMFVGVAETFENLVVGKLRNILICFLHSCCGFRFCFDGVKLRTINSRGKYSVSFSV